MSDVFDQNILFKPKRILINIIR